MDVTLDQASNDFDQLFAELTSQTREAADALFTATATDLRDTYSPGQTEKRPNLATSNANPWRHSNFWKLRVITHGMRNSI